MAKSKCCEEEMLKDETCECKGEERSDEGGKREKVKEEKEAIKEGR